MTLKLRLSRALVKPSSSGAIAVNVNRRCSHKRSSRNVCIGSSVDLAPVCVIQDPEEKEGVELLLGISGVVAREMASDSQLFQESDRDDDSEEDIAARPHLKDYLYQLNKRSDAGSPSYQLDDSNFFAWNRARSVSIDSPRSHTDSPKHVLHAPSLSLPPIVTPKSRSSRRTTLKISPHKGKKDKIKVPNLPQLARYQHQLPEQHQHAVESVHEHKMRALKMSAEKCVAISIIHRKKFSWKNYPELETFLIANRDEYLRHSALNYTVQQKQYNNRLTKRLLDLAADHGYVFDEDEFSFVTVRDRVRCYYKSFVQSSKKRGIVLGYAARKCGIISTADLQKSARKEGTIITPPEL